MTSDSNSPERIMQLAWGFAPPITIEVAIRNRVFDFLDTDAAHRAGGCGVRQRLNTGLGSGVKLFSGPRSFG